MADPALVLREPANLVSSRARTLWVLSALVPTTVLLIVGIVLQSTGVIDLPPWAWIGYVAVAAAYAVVMPAYRYRVHRWESTSTAVYTQRGWLSIERRIAPMSRVQTVDLEQHPISRLFRLATVTVTTASAAGPLRIEGLDRDVAHRLVDELTRRAEDEKGDAT